VLDEHIIRFLFRRHKNVLVPIIRASREIKMNIDDIKLQTKTLLPLSLMALVVLCMVGFGSFKLSSISGAANDIIERRDIAATTIIRASREMVMVPYSVFGSLVFDGNSEAGQKALKAFPIAVAHGAELLDQAAKLLPSHASEVNALKERFVNLTEEAKKPLKIGAETPGLEEGNALKQAELKLMAEGAHAMIGINEKLQSLISDTRTFYNLIIDENRKLSVDLRAESTAALLSLIVAGLVSVVCAGAFSVWLSSSKIAKPLVQLAERMRALANGELSIVIEGQTRRDEVGAMAQAVQVFKANAIDQVRIEKEAVSARAAAAAEREGAALERARAAEEQAQAVSQLGDALKNLAAGDLTIHLGDSFSQNYVQIRNDFNDAIDRLKVTMLNVVASTDAIQSGSQEISTASEDLSRRTEQQAASLEETAAALDEITATVKKAAEGAGHAREVVAEADRDAKKSAVVVGRAVDAMAAIAKSSQQIGQIISVIDEIAFQTNLLALNAGVEAARAGDAGRGFAVVASEVRALAQRSAEAAKEIKGLITASTVEVENGVRLVAETGKSLERIMVQVTEINGIVTDIASGAQEQATGLTQINTAVNQMDQFTQQNAAMVEESTAASHSLSQETAQLAGLMGGFRVGPGPKANGAMHEALKKVAPHVFRKPAAPSASKAVRPVGSANLSKVVNSGSSVAGWEEF
jgi:methyl-accepting chemotaxis protein